MALTGLFFDRRPRITGGVGGLSFMIFDATMTETHQHEWVWTEETVEDGSTLSDNRWKKPVPLTITVIVSSSVPGSFTRTRHVRAWDQLVALADQEPAILFTIATCLGDYENMGVTKITAPVNSATGDSLQATIIAKPIGIAFTAVAQNLADAAQDSGQGSTDLGNQGFAP